METSFYSPSQHYFAFTRACSRFTLKYFRTCFEFPQVGFDVQLPGSLKHFTYWYGSRYRRITRGLWWGSNCSNVRLRKWSSAPHSCTIQSLVSASFWSCQVITQSKTLIYSYFQKKNTGSSFDAIEALLSLSSKYMIEGLKRDVVEHLRFPFPSEANRLSNSLRVLSRHEVVRGIAMG